MNQDIVIPISVLQEKLHLVKELRRARERSLTGNDNSIYEGLIEKKIVPKENGPTLPRLFSKQRLAGAGITLSEIRSDKKWFFILADLPKQPTIFGHIAHKCTNAWVKLEFSKRKKRD